MVKLVNVIFIFFLINSCEPTNLGSTVGPCVHTFEEPVLTIKSVSSTVTGNAISSVEIFEIKIDSLSGYPASLIDEISNNISVKDSILICTIPCGFGIMEGLYEISISANGYRDLTLSTLAKYDELNGGCPSSSSGGQSISFSLSPE